MNYLIMSSIKLISPLPFSEAITFQLGICSLFPGVVFHNDSTCGQTGMVVDHSILWNSTLNTQQELNMV